MEQADCEAVGPEVHSGEVGDPGSAEDEVQDRVHDGEDQPDDADGADGTSLRVRPRVSPARYAAVAPNIPGMPHQKKANAGMHSTPHPPCHRITRGVPHLYRWFGE